MTVAKIAGSRTAPERRRRFGPLSGEPLARRLLFRIEALERR